MSPWPIVLALIALCALAHWLAYAGYKSYAEQIAFAPLDSATRLEANREIRVAVAMFGVLLAAQALCVRRFALWRWSPVSLRGGVAAVCVYGLLIRLAFDGADPRVLRFLSLACVLLLGFALGLGVRRRVVAFIAPRWRQLGLAMLTLLLSLELGLRGVDLATYPGTLEDLSRDPRLPAAGSEVPLRAMLAPSLEPGVIYGLKPGLDVRFEGARVETNAQGWREAPVSLAKPDGTVRIVGIGDSVMFGWGVEAEARYMDRLEGLLADAYPDLRWEAIVMAVPGYNLAMQVEALRTAGLAYAPDLVIYGFVGNDFALPVFLQSRPDVLSASSFIRFYWRLLWSHSAALLTDEIAGEGDAGPVYLVQDPERAPEAYRSMIGRSGFARALEELAALPGGADVVYFSFEGDAAFPRAEIPQPIRYHDATAARRRLGASFTLRDDPHPSPMGHAALADSLFAFLVESGIADALTLSAQRPDSGERGR